MTVLPQAIGNPVGLVRGLVEGASDFIAEPLEGLAVFVETADPRELRGGLRRGASSFMNNTVGGVSHACVCMIELITDLCGGGCRWPTALL